MASKIRVPKRIRLGLQQKPQGRTRYHSPHSWEMEWLSRQGAVSLAGSVAAARARLEASNAKAYASRTEYFDARLRAISRWMAFCLECTMLYGVHLEDMPRGP